MFAHSHHAALEAGAVVTLSVHDVFSSCRTRGGGIAHPGQSLDRGLLDLDMDGNAGDPTKGRHVWHLRALGHERFASLRPYCFA